MHNVIMFGTIALMGIIGAMIEIARWIVFTGIVAIQGINNALGVLMYSASGVGGEILEAIAGFLTFLF